PFDAVVAVAGFALDDVLLVLGGEVAERDVDGNFFLAGEFEEVGLGVAIGAGALPRFYGAVAEAEGAVGDGEVVIDFDDASESAAFGTGTEGRVEGEKGGAGGAEFLSGDGGLEAAAEASGFAERGIENGDFAVAVVEGGFGGFEEAGALGGL